MRVVGEVSFGSAMTYLHESFAEEASAVIAETAGLSTGAIAGIAVAVVAAIAAIACLVCWLCGVFD